jgi:hypothetical protein
VVPSLRARYLGYVRQMSEEWLDWKRVGPIAQKYQALIADDVKKDTRKLDSFEAFKAGAADEAQGQTPRGREPMNLKDFVEQRRKYLLERPDVKMAVLPKHG